MEQRVRKNLHLERLAETKSRNFLAHLSRKLKWTFFYQNLSIVSRRCRNKLYTFSSSSEGPLYQFEANLTQIIFKRRELQFVRIKGQTPLNMLKGDNSEISKIY